MKLEKIPSFEKIGKNREKLLALEKEGKFVFHGSPDIIQALEPRQAYGNNEKTGQWEKDGNPAVFATPFADFAIFRALINDKDFENSFGVNGDRLYFLADEALIERAKENTGRVYVLDRGKFSDFRGMDCRSKEKIIPLEVIEVTYEDLPPNIEIKENSDG
jgi:hypothetical protein